MFTDFIHAVARIRASAAIALLCVIAPMQAQAQLQVLDRIVAIVDEDVILVSEFQGRVMQVKQNLESRGMQMPPEDVLAREVLDRLVLERIQLQMGERVGVRISDEELNQSLNRMAASNGMTLEQFALNVEQQGESYQQIREQIRQEMVLTRVQQGNVRSRVQVTEQEVDDYLASEEGQKRTGALYRISHLLLPIRSDADLDAESEAMAYINQLRNQLSEGTRFEQFLTAPDKSRYALTGGDLGWRVQDDLPDVFSTVVPTLSVGEISEPVRSPSGLHLVKLADQRGGGNQIEAQTRVRHVLIKPSEIRTSEQAHDLAESLRQRILKGTADFGEIAREFSEDIGSAREGGDLGWVTKGQMVPQFESVMTTTGANEVSSVFETQFGWHFLEVVERRDLDVSEETKRNQARGILYQQKYEEELENWLQKIRDEAFVEIKL